MRLVRPGGYPVLNRRARSERARPAIEDKRGRRSRAPREQGGSDIARRRQHPADPHRCRHPGRGVDAQVLATGGTRRGVGGRAPAGDPPRAGPGPGAVPRRVGRPGPGRPGLSAPRCGPCPRPAGGRRSALRLPRLALRRGRALPGHPGRAAGQPAGREGAAGLVPGARAQRNRLGLPRPGRAARPAGPGLLRRPRRVHLRLERVPGLQLLGIDWHTPRTCTVSSSTKTRASATASSSGPLRRVPSCR
jgi:hypothetical protein